MLLKDNLNKKILITQIKSEIGLVKNHKLTLIGLGLRGINTDSTLFLSLEVLGMINKVNHLIKVSFQN